MANLHIIAAALNAKLFGESDQNITDVTHDSHFASTGCLFVAIRGKKTDGHAFVEDVMRRGAVGVISESEAPENFTGAWLQVENARIALAQAAAVINDNPSHKLKFVGITGTNGKTTTTYLTYALAEANGEKGAMLTTVEYRIGENSIPAVRTTPEASYTQRFLAKALEAGCTMAIMETSSEGIDLHRCDALRFQVAIFTNLTRDHLDYHLTMENYFDAKKRLFDGRLGEKPASSVINIDDKWGATLARELKENGQRVVTFALDSPADVTANNIHVSLLKGTSFLLKTPKGERQVTSPLIGKPHVYNILAATSASLELGFDLDKIVKGIETCVRAPGRFELVPHNGDFVVVVDYAHTDNALLNTLKTARDLTKGRIITVFGCGGDKDKTKRVPMGEVAGKHSDLVIITSDNPRTEDPLKIISQIEVGIKDTNCEYLIVHNRRKAIQTAIQEAKAGDFILIAGKGHETYQEIDGIKSPFDDREIACEALERLNEGLATA